MIEVPCRLLIGPLYNPGVIGAYAGHPDIKLFMPESSFSQRYAYDLVYPLEQLSHFNQIFDYLPAGWEPDLVLWWDPVYQAIPPGIEDCRYPIALIPGDWNLAFGTVLQMARAVDGVLADGRLGPILRQAGVQNVQHWPGFAYDARTIYREPDLEALYDICFIGNMNPSIHPRRSRILAGILPLQDRYRLFLRQGVWGDEYRRALNQSRIVLNYTICQVMNMRAYEAPACGALLFIEDENLEVREVFSDRVSCVLYNESNLLGLLEYYLEHEDERAAIAAAGQRIVQAYSYERQFERLLGQIPALLAGCAPSRALLAQPAARRRLHALNQIAASNQIGAQLAAASLQQVWQQLSGAALRPEQVWELNALLVLLFPYLDEDQQLQQSGQVSLSDLRQGFEKALALDHANPVLCYHHGLTCEYDDDETQALWSYSHAIELMARGHQAILVEYRDFLLPFNKSGRGLDQMAFEWERVSYEAIEQGRSVEQDYVALLSSSIWQRIARILTGKQDYAKALIAIENAYLCFPRAVLKLELSRLYRLSEQVDKILPAFHEAIALQPLLIAQLSEVLTPDLLLRQADWVAASCRLYQSLFPSLATLGLLAELAGAQPVWSLLALSEMDFKADFYQWLCLILQRGKAAEALAPLQVLRQPWGLRWALPLELPPALELGTGLYWGQGPELPLLSESPGQLQRVHDRPSDPARGRLGPDRFPWLFELQPAAQPSPGLAELLASPAQKLLLVLEDWSPERLTELLSAFEAGWGQDEHWMLLLWSPPGCSFSFSQLEAAMPPEMQAQLAWLEDSLGLQDQAALLCAASGVLAMPRGRGVFYGAWAKALQRPVCWHDPPEWLPPGLELPVEPDSRRALELISIAEISSSTDAASISDRSPPPARSAKSAEALQQAWLKGIWQLRLHAQLGTLDPTDSTGVTG